MRGFPATRPDAARLAVVAPVVIMLLLLAGAPAAAGHKPRRHHRPGCGTFCRQAGPPAGGGGPPPVIPVKLYGHVLHVHGGSVTVEVKCILVERCVGAIGVWSDRVTSRGNPFGRLGAVDLSIPEGKRTRVTVPLDPKALAVIGRQRVKSVPAGIRAFEKGRCFGPSDCAISGEAERDVRVTLR